MVNKLLLVTLYLSAFAVARPSLVRRQDEAPEVPEDPVEDPGMFYHP